MSVDSFILYFHVHVYKNCARTFLQSLSLGGCKMPEVWFALHSAVSNL